MGIARIEPTIEELLDIMDKEMDKGPKMDDKTKEEIKGIVEELMKDVRKPSICFFINTTEKAQAFNKALKDFLNKLGIEL